MDGGNMHGMDGHGMGMGMDMAPKSSPSTNSSSMMMGHKMHGMMHMTFFWGKDALILFDGWPGGRTDMYVLALIVIFVMSVLIELLSHTRFIKPGSNSVGSSLVQTLLHLLRVGLSYLVMLALMSFNGGVFLVAVLGHALGFFFCTRAFKNPKQENHDCTSMCRPVVKGIGMWGSVKALARGYEYLMAVIIFAPVAIFSWFPFVSEFQTRLLFNQAFSRGFQIQRILSGGKKNK